MLIKMIDGGLVNYTDDCWHMDGCPTCDWGSKYVNEIEIALTKYKIHVKTSQMYDYALSEGQMMRLFLSEYNAIQNMTEKNFTEWLKAKLCEITHDDFDEAICDRTIKKFEVTEVT